ncbi:ABC transporter permease [Desulfolucanica intricata]|uniref:ABC transporter permease n=1 Tax=Desulfolucanica intricata TaxID=1285191 RepID=UPI0008310C6A|nr:ABC transporter permease [Desulfolucanica intricata]
MLKQCLNIMHREIFYMWRDRSLRNLLLIGPLLGLVLFYATYSAQALKDIPTAIVDLDQSAASRELVSNLNYAENLKVLAYPESYDKLEELVKRGKIVVGIVIPENFGQKVGLGRQANIFTMVDGSNMIYSTNAVTAVLTVTRTVSAEIGIKSLLARGINYNQARDVYQTINFREEPWFNPTLNYAYFLVLALALNVWQQCCMLAACMNIIGERGRSSWYQIKSSGISKAKLFFSKSLIHISVFMLLVLPIYFLTFVVLKVPLRCNFFIFLLFTLLFVIALHSIGTLASSFSRSAVDSSRFGMIIALPSFILSGYTWPLEAMPHYTQQLTKLLPQTWFFQGINYFTFKNPGLDFMARYFLILSVIAVICYGVAALIVSRS